jgi:hypothetical protein
MVQQHMESAKASESLIQPSPDIEPSTHLAPVLLPGNCGCLLHFSYDDVLGGANGTEVPKASFQTLPIHTGTESQRTRERFAFGDPRPFKAAVLETARA